MPTRAVIAGLLVLFVANVTSAQIDDVELPSIVGRWKRVKAEGLTHNHVFASCWEFSGAYFWMPGLGGKKFTYTIDMPTRPPWISKEPGRLTIFLGERTLSKAICKVDGDRLIMALGDERPTGFDDLANSSIFTLEPMDDWESIPRSITLDEWRNRFRTSRLIATEKSSPDE